VGVGETFCVNAAASVIGLPIVIEAGFVVPEYEPVPLTGPIREPVPVVEVTGESFYPGGAALIR